MKHLKQERRKTLECVNDTSRMVCATILGTHSLPQTLPQLAHVSTCN